MAAALFPAPVAAAEPAPSVDLFRGSVSYSDRSCQGGLDGDYRPLAGARVVAVRGNSKDSDRLGPDGDYNLFLDGSGPAQAWVILNSPTVQVGPNAFLDGDPYKIPIRDLVAGAKNKNVFRDMAPAGAANIFRIASEGAALAAKVASPAKVPKVRLAWRYGHDLTKKVEISAADHTAYYPDSNEIILDGQHEWDPATILHEYGHHLMWSVADPGNQTAPSRHHADATYPTAPAAGLSEGFATAFAALIVGPNVKVHCRDNIFRLDSVPATTSQGPIDHPRLAQYNETRVAGTFWQITTYLEARDSLSPTKAFRQVVLALHNYKRVAGHPPHDMREVRDSLIAQGLQYNDPHQAQQDFDKIFAAQGLGWGVFATVEFADERSGGSGAWSEIHLVLDGPYGRCEVTTNDGSIHGETESPSQTVDGGDFDLSGTIGPKGDLPYTWQDDCLATGGDGRVSEDSVATITGAQMILGFPYLKSGKHLSGKYTLTARFACANHLDPDPDDPAPSLCTGDRRVRISVLNGGAFDVTGYGDDVSGYLNLPRGQDTQVLEWTARGQCKIADGTDCSV